MLFKLDKNECTIDYEKSITFISQGQDNVHCKIIIIKRIAS